MNKRKFFGTIIGIIFWSVCVVYFSYAYYEWKSIDTSIVLGIQDLATKCSKGPNVNVSNIGPVFYPSDGVKVKFNLTNDLMTSQNFSIQLNVTSISDTLLVDDFKWILIKEGDYDNPLVEGEFSNFSIGTNTIISSMSLDSGDKNLYQFIVYIDGNMKNNTNIQNNSMNSYLEIGNCGIIAEANQMINSSTSNFRHADYINNIVTASFVDYTPFTETQDVSSQTDISSSDLSLKEENLIPSMLTDTTDLIYWDVSKYQDGRVIAWLEDNGTTDDSGNTNYNLYIGSDELIYPTDLAYFFDGMIKLTSIDFSNLDTSLVTTMVGMFRSCSSLTNLDLSNFNTSNVTKMGGVNSMDGGMFKNCSSLVELDLSNFDTSKVTNMAGMFENCSSLISLDLSNFDTSNVIHMNSAYTWYWGGMFSGCSNLTTLDLSSFDTSKVTSMSNMFNGCSSLVELDLSNFDTSNVTNMISTFKNCNKLINLNLSSFDTSKVTSMSNMFNGCSSLVELDLNNFDTSEVTSMLGMFGGCKNLIKLDLSNFNTSNVTVMGNHSAGNYGMFSGCSSLVELNISNFNTSKVTDMAGMFQNCSSLVELDLSHFDTSKVTSMGSNNSGWTWGGMFENCVNLTNLNLNNWNISNVAAMNRMFYNCGKIVTTIIIRNTSTTYVNMFNGAATAEGSSITVNYTTETSSLVDEMLKTGTGNLIKPDNPVPILAV